MLYLKNIFRAALDHVGDSVPVSRTQHQRLQDKHVQSALQQVSLKRWCSPFWHTKASILP